MNFVIAWGLLLMMVIAGMGVLAASSSAVRVPLRALTGSKSRRRQTRRSLR